MNNEIKNTLFRFVNFRAPELISDLDNHPGFVVKNPSFRLFCDDAVNALGTTGSKFNVLKAAAVTFGPSAKKVGDIKALSADLFTFSEWLSKNRLKATEAEIQTKATDSRLQVTAVTNFDLKLLWDNLVYQVVTQNDFYAKEVLMQYLIALHVIKNTSIGTYKERALAKVVLPENLFIENPVVETPGVTPSVKEVLFPNQLFKALDKQSLAEQNIAILNTLHDELEAAESEYRTNYQAAYATAFEEYRSDPDNVALLDQYELDLDEAKRIWIAAKDKTIVFNPADPSHQIPTVRAPKLPNFSFSFSTEMDTTFLSGFMSTDSYAAYQRLIQATDDDADDDDEIDVFKATASFRKVLPAKRTFSATKAVVKQLIAANASFSKKNTVDFSSTALILGGTRLNIPNTQSTLQPFECEVKVNRKSSLLTIGVKNLQIMVGIPDDKWNISTLQYKMTKIDNSFIIKNSAKVVYSPGYNVMLNLPMDTITANLKELLLTFQFENGKTGTLTIPNFALNKVYNGKVVLPIETFTGTPVIINSTVAPEKQFIPSGFGVKNIGIAEYNKVEQSIQGYVEGEVAHIENIMAREFKEKSTRRLRRKEETQTLTSETEREQLTDTSTVDRFEMQSEVAKLLANSKDFNGGVNSTYSPDKTFQISAMANYASNNSKEESTRMAVTQAKEVIERALDRIVSKVKEERIEKMVEEFEENNTHGFDNRKGDQHVVGVYRWVDKVYKNQIVNYGKRMMYEFAIPEPARLHNLGMSTLVEGKKAKALTIPQDPRTSTIYKLRNYSELDDTRLKHWSGIYNVEFNKKPVAQLKIGKSFSFVTTETSGHEWDEVAANNSEIEIPEGYKAISGTAILTHVKEPGHGSFVVLGTQSKKYENNLDNFAPLMVTLSNYTDKVPVSFSTCGHHSGSANFEITCSLTSEAEDQWKLETFNAIVKAYEAALEKYNEDLAVETANGVQILGSNPGFYREIENIILRKNCISYLISSNPSSKLTFGKDFYKKNNADSTLHFGNTIVNNTADLDGYAAFIKFIEQAFEWDIMSYYFYPFYWGSSTNWLSMYQFDQTNDPVFKAFMQSGMARVIVTVRPGFEEAVRYYMQTGQIWMGGEVPVIGDKLYQSIVEEMRKTEGEKVGKAWPTRVPTSMTILQADSIGLKVDIGKPLPFDTAGLQDFEFPNEVPQSTMFEKNTAQVGIEQTS